jgi:hypothetical protein
LRDVLEPIPVQPIEIFLGRFGVELGDGHSATATAGGFRSGWIHSYGFQFTISIHRQLYGLL